MSLFIDVVDTLSDKIKIYFVEIIEKEKDGQERPVRKICDFCRNYLLYGELRYDKVEKGIEVLNEMNPGSNAFYQLLLAVLNEAQDEDLIAVNHLTELSGSSLSGPFREAMGDFITVGRFSTLKEYDKLENAGMILVERYTNETNIYETLANLYIKAESEAYLPVFIRLLTRAKELYPASIQLESLNGFMNNKSGNYEQALESYLTVKDRLEQDRDNRLFNFNLASMWDSIANCYLKMGDAAKTIESCDNAISYDEKSEDYLVGNPILYKKSEAMLLLGEKDQALAIIKHILDENGDDRQALTLRESIMNS